MSHQTYFGFVKIKKLKKKQEGFEMKRFLSSNIVIQRILVKKKLKKKTIQQQNKNYNNYKEKD